MHKPAQWSPVLTLALAVIPAVAQDAAAPPTREKFEVASIRAADPAAHGSSSNTDRRFLTIKNWNLKRLVERAFGVQDYQVAGGPNWLESYKFDIRAKVDDAAPELKGKETQKRLQDMMQGLLDERFQFQFHRETKVMSCYNLVVTRNGMKIEPVKDTGSSSMNDAGSSNGEHLTAKGVNLDQLAVFLSQTLQQPVLNTTGLAGPFDFELNWAPQETGPRQPDANEIAGPSIFTALQEQLGLKLESAKGPVEIIVVDHAEKPTDN